MPGRATAVTSGDALCKEVVALGESLGLKAREQYRCGRRVDAYLEKVAHGVYRVIPEFRRVTWDEFQDLVTQVRRPFASYTRATYQAVVVYDFLMPLTREDKLRKALDELFYRDTLVRRIHRSPPTPSSATRARHRRPSERRVVGLRGAANALI
jgi:hypothetical protein